MNKDDSDDSFEKMIGDVRRITTDRTVNRTPPPKPVPTQRLRDERKALRESQADFDPVDIEFEAGEALQWCQSGVERDLRRLKRGDFSIQATLDLHGLTATQARAVITEFLDEACDEGWRCVRIIHGKGLGSPDRIPVLKSKTARWLRARKEVIAFASAPTHDGGTGVAYALLAKPRQSAE